MIPKSKLKIAIKSVAIAAIIALAIKYILIACGVALCAVLSVFLLDFKDDLMQERKNRKAERQKPLPEK